MSSLNVPTVRLAMAVGMDEVARTALAAGLKGPVLASPSSALGTVSGSPIEVAEAYTSFARPGPPAVAHLVRRIEADDGTEVSGPLGFPREENPEGGGIDPRVAYIVTNMLEDVVERGTGVGVRTAGGFLGTAAGKTGTTQNGHDVWFVGYTPELVGVVWIGFDRPAPILPAATGGGLAAPVWGRMMARIDPSGREGVSGGEFGSAGHRPEGIVRLEIDPATGETLEEGCAPARGDGILELFLVEHTPITACPRRPNLLSRIVSAIRRRSDDPPTRSATSGSELLDLTDGPELLLGFPKVRVTEPPAVAWSETLGGAGHRPPR